MLYTNIPGLIMGSCLTKPFVKLKILLVKNTFNLSTLMKQSEHLHQLKSNNAEPSEDLMCCTLEVRNNGSMLAHCHLSKNIEF